MLPLVYLMSKYLLLPFRYNYLVVHKYKVRTVKLYWLPLIYMPQICKVIDNVVLKYNLMHIVNY